MGQSIFDFAHARDEDEIREALSARPQGPKAPITEERVFFLRLKCTLTSKGRNVNLKSASYKVWMRCYCGLFAVTSVLSLSFFDLNLSQPWTDMLLWLSSIVCNEHCRRSKNSWGKCKFLVTVFSLVRAVACTVWHDIAWHMRLLRSSTLSNVQDPADITTNRKGTSAVVQWRWNFPEVRAPSCYPLSVALCQLIEVSMT